MGALKIEIDPRDVEEYCKGAIPEEDETELQVPEEPKEQPEEPDTQPRRKLSDNPFIRRDSEEGKPFDRTYQTPAQIRKAEAAKRAEAEKAAAEAEKQRLADSHYSLFPDHRPYPFPPITDADPPH